MMTDLRAALHAEAIKAADQFYETAMRLFTAQIATVLGAPVSLPEPAPEAAQSRGERLSQEKIEEALARIIELLEKHPSGLRSEQIRAELGMDKKLFQYAAHLGKTSDQLAQEGERRLTVYSLPVRPSTAQAEGRVIKKKKRRG